MDLVRFVGAAASALLLHAGGASAARFIGDIASPGENAESVVRAQLKNVAIANRLGIVRLDNGYTLPPRPERRKNEF